MKILIVGYGSMGRRRIRLLQHMSADYTFICVDNNAKRLEQISADGYKGFARLSDAIAQKPDAAFVCTSPGHHAEIILEIIEAGIHVFTELNLISYRYDEIISKANEKHVKVFMSNTMLYDKQILSIMEKVGTNPNHLSYIYHVGQYLPDWHPWESYKDFFIGRKETNGCREILAIQLPWIVKLFGNVININVIRSKNTQLEIDFDDTFIISLEHENGNTGVFVCDVLARKAVNYLEIMGEELYLTWNGTPESLFVLDNATQRMELLDSYSGAAHVEGYADIIFEDQYADEIQAFLDYIDSGKQPCYTLQDDRLILGLIDEIEGKK